MHSRILASSTGCSSSEPTRTHSLAPWMFCPNTGISGARSKRTANSRSRYR